MKNRALPSMNNRQSRFVGAASQRKERGSLSLMEVRCCNLRCKGAGLIILEN
jgi:hypothetical protein